MNLPYSQIWAVDFEFMAAPGERPDPVCMVAHELRSNTRLRLWRDELLGCHQPPFSTGADTLCIAYFASAEMGCFLELGWPVPMRVLDLYAEFRNLTNGRRVECGSGLVGALVSLGLEGLDAIEKDAMRQLILRGGPWSEGERRAILEYCEGDVLAVTRLLPAMLPLIDLPRALLRGRYMTAVARMEHCGVPIDGALHRRLVTHWEQLKTQLIDEIDSEYGVFEGSRFVADRFADYLEREGLAWPRLPSGRLDLKDDTFRDRARAHPQIQPLQELRASLSSLRLNGLTIGSDDRNRTLLSPFGTKTGRNAPSTSRFIFGMPAWLRHTIQPRPGQAIAYIDWAQQEFGIGAALSGDANMLAAYASGDPYLTFAKQAKAAPPDATKQSHGAVRDLYKTCALGVQFGMGAESLAARIGQPVLCARDLLQHHQRTYREFWRWSDAAADRFSLVGSLQTVFGWTLRDQSGDGERTARNFPVQGNGAEMMRLAACLMTEAGIAVCAPVHDAFLIEAAATELDDVVDEAQHLMAQASSLVLSGFELRSEAVGYVYPERYTDPRGQRMFEVVQRLLPTRSATDAGGPSADATDPPAAECSSLVMSI